MSPGGVVPLKFSLAVPQSKWGVDADCPFVDARPVRDTMSVAIRIDPTRIRPVRDEMFVEQSKSSVTDIVSLTGQFCKEMFYNV